MFIEEKLYSNDPHTTKHNKMTTKKVDQWLEHLSSKGRLIRHDLGAREKEANNEELKVPINDRLGAVG